MIYINDLIRGFTARLGHSAYAAPLPGCTRPSGNLESQTGAGRSPLWVDSVAKVVLSQRSQIFRAVGAAIEY
jgi:hypothetical protein